MHEEKKGMLPNHVYLTPGEIANHTRFAYATVLRWLQRGDLRGKKRQGQWRVLWSDFRSFWESRNKEESCEDWE